MKKVSLIAGVTSLAAIAGVLWSVPAAADMCGMAPCAARAVHDRLDSRNFGTVSATTPTTGGSTVGVPEPATLALFALGFGGLGLSALRRRRAKA